MQYQLTLDNLACQRGERPLFTGLSYVVKQGDFVQIDGHNGIGKTSLLRILAGLARPVAGRVCWNGIEISQCRETFHGQLLYLGHQAGVKPELTALENLQFYQRISANHTTDDALWQALNHVGLLGYEDIPTGQLSAGQQKRIALARLWLSQAPVWILDEPFNAIDKKGVIALTALFEKHCQQGMVILTSHQNIPSNRLQKLSLADYKVQGESMR